jgi:hypothetical protein
MKSRPITKETLKVACPNDVAACDVCESMGELTCVLYEERIHAHVCVLCYWQGPKRIFKEE